MTRPDDENDEKWDVLGRFLEELQSAAHVEPVLRRYSEAHPAWARDFFEEAVLNRVLDEGRPDFGLPDPSLFQDFRVLRRIASGGMGVVFEAEQLSLRRRVALKVRHGVDSPERRAAFEREQHTLALLHHSHIVAIHHSGQCGDRQFFTMAFINGPSLHQVLRETWRRAFRNESVPSLLTLIEELGTAPRAADLTRFTRSVPDFTVCTMQGASEAEYTQQSRRPVRLPAAYFRSIAGLIADAAEAVSHAHAANVVHRDIKPSNIMLDAAGQCFLIDFGLAEMANRGALEHPKLPGKPAGTPGYIAPERLDAGSSPFNMRSDIWSLGATFFEALTLRRPEPDGPSIEALAPGAPADLAAICRKAMLPVDRRYGSAMELANDLHCWMEGRPTSARPIATWLRCAMWCSRNKGWAASLVAGVALLAGAFAFLILHAEHRAERAELRSQTALAEAAEERRIALLRERESWLMDAQQLSGTDARNGWFPKAWSLLERANAVQSDDKLRDLAVASLGGIDVQLTKDFSFGGSAIAFDPRSDRVMIGGWTDPQGRRMQPAKVWSSISDELIESPRTEDGLVAFSTNGHPVQLLRTNGALVLWDLETKSEVWRAAAPGDPLDPPPVALATDASLIAAAEKAAPERPRTRIWRANSVAPILETGFAAEAIAFSPSGEFVALANSATRRLEVHSLSTLQTVAELPTDALPLCGLAFGRNAKPGSEPLSHFLLAAGDSGGTVTVWNLRTRMPLSHCRGMARKVNALAFHPDGTLLATGGRDDVQLWDVSTGKSILRIRTDRGMDYVTQMAFTPDGESLGIASLGVFYPASVTIWKIQVRRGLQTLRGFTGQVERIVVSPDGRRVAALAQNWEVGIWDLATGHLLRLVDVPPGSYADNAALIFSRDGQSITYSVGSDSNTRVIQFDVDTAKELGRWTLPPGLQNTMAFDDLGRLLHFQVELDRGHALPHTHFSWKEHARTGRLRILSGKSPGMAVSEIRDFARHVFVARITPNGQWLVIDGLENETVQSLKVFRTDSGRVAATRPITRKSLGSDLTLDTNGRAAWVTDDHGLHRLELPGGPDRICSGTSILASSGTTSFYCCRSHGEEAGCLLGRSGAGSKIANLSHRTTVNHAAFDAAGQRLIWGAPSGHLFVCDLPTVLHKLQSLGIAW